MAPFIPTVVGLAIIPFIVTPLDVLADVLLDVTMRRLIFASIDKDHTGKLTKDELVAKLQSRPEYLPKDKILELFHEMDKDGDGAISMEEWCVPRPPPPSCWDGSVDAGAHDERARYVLCDVEMTTQHLSDFPGL